MSVRDSVRPIADMATDLVTREVDYWRDEIERPWREGSDEPAARLGRWIGVGLTAAALVAGVAAAIRVERAGR
ncbi:MAG: hypothetical protein R3195_09880 [Gemmatimonadota bacterium]|nr:hypothetical protein [Gemmatimonadota bacterium]